MDVPKPTEDTLWTKEGLKNVASILASVPEDGNKGWDSIWRADFAPPWDSGDVQPALKELIQEKNFELPKDGQVLVPGCGRGYDVAFFASLGYQVVGLDVSEKGVEAARAYLSSLPGGIGKDAAERVVVGDFFAHQAPGDGYSVIYDYTFSVALPPPTRPKIFEHFKKLVRPGGYFIGLVFPIDGDRPGGPPFTVGAEEYHGRLTDDGSFERVYWAKPERIARFHENREMIGVWKRV
ncbi:S-adenosyl-L-methionine-dependent methyltransferase [Ramaria rubella]|nr:S-adenosyl-L-methionine-dependent methyltransferase [Ramaria rubella]